MSHFLVIASIYAAAFIVVYVLIRLNEKLEDKRWRGR